MVFRMLALLAAFAAASEPVVKTEHVEAQLVTEKAAVIGRNAPFRVPERDRGEGFLKIAPDVRGVGIEFAA